jgi:competence protein ComEA
VPEIIVPNGWRERVQELQSRRGAWIVAGFGVIAVVVALMLWLRGAPAQVAPPATEGPITTAAPAIEASPSQTSGQLYVDVSGEVRRPGLYSLDPGSRVADAIEAAGGASPRADLDPLNLAEPLTDGVKVDVARKGEVASATVPLSGASSSPTVAVININTADEPTLEQIPGVGPVTANAILDYRNRIGGFSSIEQLLDVNGIGPATVENIRPYITI